MNEPTKEVKPLIDVKWEGPLTELVITVKVKNAITDNLVIPLPTLENHIRAFCESIAGDMVVQRAQAAMKGQIGRTKAKGTVRDTPPDKLVAFNEGRITKGLDPIIPEKLELRRDLIAYMLEKKIPLYPELTK